MTPSVLARSWADELTAAGIRAGVNPKDVVPPCVLFTPPDQVRFDLACGGTADLRALVLVPGPGQADAWAALDGFLPEVLNHLPVPPDELRTTTYTVDASGPMPAYELSFTHTVDWSFTP